MDLVLLLLPLVGGYVFARRWNVTEYRVAREEGHRLYFRAAFYAVFLFGCAALLRLYFLSTLESYRVFEETLFEVAPLFKQTDRSYQQPILSISLYAFLLGVAFWWPLNLVTLPRWRNKLLVWSIRDRDFERLLHTAATRAMPLALTMDNKKVYVGFVITTVSPDRDVKTISILPLVSGYRSAEGQLKLTTFYTHVYDKIANTESIMHLSPDDFEIVLPTERIQSANLFDLAAYQEFQAKGPLTATRKK